MLEKVESESEGESGNDTLLRHGASEGRGRPLMEFSEIRPYEKGTIGIDAVRGVAGFLYARPVFSSRRTVFIDDAEALTPEAQSALLKIVEEPPAWGLIFISATNLENVLPTLRSRLQQIYVPPQRARISGSQKRIPADKKLSLEEILATKEIDDAAVDSFFADLLIELDKEPIDNVRYLKAALARLRAIKSWNTNIRLQLRALATLTNDQQPTTNDQR